MSECAFHPVKNGRFSWIDDGVAAFVCGCGGSEEGMVLNIEYPSECEYCGAKLGLRQVTEAFLVEEVNTETKSSLRAP